jgi:phospholipase/lecithinase/hemolysin
LWNLHQRKPSYKHCDDLHPTTDGHRRSSLTTEVRSLEQKWSCESCLSKERNV